MSVYLSQWLNGPSEFYSFAVEAWDPSVDLELDDSTGVTIAKVTVRLFNSSAMDLFVSDLDFDIRKTFMTRFSIANEYIIEKLKAEEFVKTSLKLLVHYDLEQDEMLDKLNTEFQNYVTDMEFWNRLDLPEVFSNLIFYGTIEDPKPYFFFVPPMSQWDDYPDGWKGYTPY
jgi:hypothetical protein